MSSVMSAGKTILGLASELPSFPQRAAEYLSPEKFSTLPVQAAEYFSNAPEKFSTLPVQAAEYLSNVQERFSTLPVGLAFEADNPEMMACRVGVIALLALSSMYCFSKARKAKSENGQALLYAASAGAGVLAGATAVVYANHAMENAIEICESAAREYPGKFDTKFQESFDFAYKRSSNGVFNGDTLLTKAKNIFHQVQCGLAFDPLYKRCASIVELPKFQLVQGYFNVFWVEPMAAQPLA